MTNANCTIEIENYEQIEDVRILRIFDPFWRVSEINPETSKDVIAETEELALNTWQKSYNPEGFNVPDGISWRIRYEETEPDRSIEINGNNAYPRCFHKLIRILISLDEELAKTIGRYAKKVKCFY